ncbi:hypothetical protein [Streptomyces sp. NBC_01294]|uniref:hypothetical protein n=1 Tax=Streptomyces sp. NBC_01294 TaxID=2903815 RepID=UPI002DDA9867|nr:hypothetical protein [Streptomyces sp. NBC_01294]WRZ55060.1 hypothetical protein OG534_00040 [Streptomyces sp. NBC_01294]WRZ61641.1 hypothetical protein OG534_37415 [Streptomyces sp. NBC_01294]
MNTWQDLVALVEVRLEATSPSVRGVFAAGVAERLMSWHETLPEAEQAAFTLGLRPLLNSVWEGALGDPAAFTAVNRGLAEYVLGDHCHNDGQAGPDDAHEPAAAASLNAAYAYLFGCTELAVWASRRAVDGQHLEYLAKREEGCLLDTDKALIDELKRRLRDLDLVAARSTELRHALFGLPILTSIPLRVDLRTPLSSRD